MWLNRASWLEHDWAAQWAVDKELPHTARVQVITYFALQIGRCLRIRLPGSRSVATIRQIGPGLVYETIVTPFGRVIVIETVTPIAPLFQRVHHILFADWTVPRFVAKLALTMFAIQFEYERAHPSEC